MPVDQPTGVLDKLLKTLTWTIDEDIVKQIIHAVRLPADDLGGLGKDLAWLRSNADWHRELTGSRKIPPSQRKTHAKSIKSHAEKLYSVLCFTREDDAWVQFWGLIYNREHDESLKSLSEFLKFLRALIADADQIISDADAEIQNTKKNKLRDPSSTEAQLHRLFSPPRTISWIVARELAPIFEKHFGRKATVSRPSEAAADRTPRGPFVRFVNAAQLHLKLFPEMQKQVSAETIASALAETKSRRD